MTVAYAGPRAFTGSRQIPNAEPRRSWENPRWEWSGQGPVPETLAEPFEDEPACETPRPQKARPHPKAQRRSAVAPVVRKAPPAPTPAPCPACQSPSKPWGRDRDGEPRRQCKGCRKTFRLNGKRRKPAAKKPTRSEAMTAVWARLTPEERSERGRRAAAKRLAVQSRESRVRGSKLVQARMDPALRSEHARRAAAARWRTKKGFEAGGVRQEG